MNLYQTSQNFKSESDATDYFEYVRWGNTVKCSHCGTENQTERATDFRYYCGSCRRRFSVTIGTHLESTNLSLIQWIMAFALITDAKKGISAKQLERNLGISYSTA